MADNALGEYLKARRLSLDPTALGFTLERRRTPGLRREEVALRASISPTWYAWLEQGRGGAPSSDVLDRLVPALKLTEREREHLHLLAFGRSPDIRSTGSDQITPRLQRVLEGLDPRPAIIRNLRWDVLAWNRAATVMQADFDNLDPGNRNILRLLFLNPHARSMQADWEATAKFVIGAFRMDAARAGSSEDTQSLILELSEASAAFRELWNDNSIEPLVEGIKEMHHPTFGTLSLEYSAFSVEGRTDLSLCIYNPADDRSMACLAKAVSGLLAQAR